MKKYRFFQTGIFMSLLMLCHISFGQFMPQFGSLQLTYPLNNSVFQQDNNNHAKVSFAGQILKGTYYTNTQLNSLVIKIEQYDYTTGAWNNNNAYSISFEKCTDCNDDPNIDPKTFYLNSSTVADLSKGWYRASIGQNISYCNISRFIPITSWTKFGVGDVYVVAGQSNASGFTRDYDNTLIPFEASLDNTNNDANGTLPTNAISDSDIPEGSIIYRINKPRGAESYNIPQGLPLFLDQPSDNIKGFRKFISGKSGQNNVMSLAPNGVDSWSWCRFSNEMVNDASKKYPVLTFNVAIPNTSIVEWADESTNINPSTGLPYPSQFDTMLKPTLQMYGGAFGVKAILWQQGEKETSIMVNAPPIGGQPIYTVNYTAKLNQIIGLSRTAMGGGNNMNWVIGQTSYSAGGSPQRTDARVVSSALTSGQYSNRFIASNASGNLISMQIGAVNNTNVFTGFNSDNFTENFRSFSQKLHLDGYQPSGSGNNGLLQAGLGWYNAVKDIGNANNISPKQPNKIKVTKNGNQYTLSLVDPSNGANITTGNFYWIRNELGIGSQEMTSSTYPISTNIPSAYYITCYYQVDANSPFTPSQPYYVQQTCNGCRVGVVTSPITRTIPISASGGSGYSLFDNIKEGAFPKINTCLSWVSISFDENTNTLVAIASANTTGSSRNGQILVIDEVTGVTIQTLNVTQSAQDCQVPLTNLSPTNSNSEWQGYGTMQINKTIDQNVPLKVGGTVPTTSGIGTHAYSRLVYNINNQYTTFSGKVGLDDEVDNSCGGTQKVRFVIKGNNNPTPLWDSGIIGITDVALQFTVSVTGINTLELIVEPLDNNYCDHADWLDPMLSCGTSSCTIPANPTNTYASSPSISLGGSTAINTTCPLGSTAAWSTGQTGNSVTVSPTSTTTYTVKCKNGTCESVGQESVTVTVGTQTTGSGLTAGTCYFISPKTNLSNNMQVMGDGSIQRQGATTASNQIWRAVASSGNQLKFSSVANDLYITVGTPNYADHMYLSTNSNNYQSFNVDANAGYYRLSIPTYNVTWDMEGAGGGQYLQNYGNTNEGFLDYRLWRFQTTSCPNTTTSGLTNNSCYIIRSVQTNNPLQAMSDGKIKQQSGNGQNDQIWKAESSGNQFMFKTMSNNQSK